MSEEQSERLLRKPEIKRDQAGRFEQHGATLAKKAGSNKGFAKSIVLDAVATLNEKPIAIKETVSVGRGGKRQGAGRPVGSKNKVSQSMREMILRSLDEVGGVEYLKRLAIENSSAYAGLLGKVLPSTLDQSLNNRGPEKITFERVIVWPDGRRETENSQKLIEHKPVIDVEVQEVIEAPTGVNELNSDGGSTLERHERDIKDYD